MKPCFYILIQSICLLSGIIHAQNNGTGVFLTAEDFLNGKVAHTSKQTHIKLHEFFKKDIIEVKTPDSTYTYFKKNIFGYQDNGGNAFRIFNGNIYTIVNPNETILIYKVSAGPPQKGQAQRDSYYFSKNVSSEILPLSINYFENAFGDNKEFQKILEIHFSSSDSLLEYDNVHKMYKINRLLELSKK